MMPLMVVAAWRLVLAGCSGRPPAAPLEAYGRLPSVDELVDLAGRVEAGRRGHVQRPVTPRCDVRSTMDRHRAHTRRRTDKIRRLDWVGSDDLVIATSRTGYIPDLVAAQRVPGWASTLNTNTQKVQPLLEGPRQWRAVRQAQHSQPRHRAGLSRSSMPWPAPGSPHGGGEPTLFVSGSRPTQQGRPRRCSGGPKSRRTADRRPRRALTQRYRCSAPTASPVARSTYDEASGRWTGAAQAGAGAGKEARAIDAKTDRRLARRAWAATAARCWGRGDAKGRRRTARGVGGRAGASRGWTSATSTARSSTRRATG